MTYEEPAMFAMHRTVAEQLVADRRAGREADAQRYRLRRRIARTPEHETATAVSLALAAPVRPLGRPARSATPPRGSKVA